MMKLLFFVGFMFLGSGLFSLYKYYLSWGCFILSTLLLSFCYWGPLSSVYYFLGVDSFNYLIVLFTIWLFGLIFLSIDVKSKFLLVSLLVLMLSLLVSFLSMNFMIFYIFFEISIIPVYLMISMMGVGYARFHASMYLLMYTLFSSLPLLWVLSSLYLYSDSLMYMYMGVNHYLLNAMTYFFIIFAFLVKMPIYLFHIWLPKAHVEAPFYGSMILAGILLKLGSYGLLRVTLIFVESGALYNLFYMVFAILGSLFSSLICLRQCDLKILIAYSSVVHMGVLMAGMLTQSFVGVMGSYYMMVAHGMCSSGLFYLVNLNYSRLNSRLIFFNKGLLCTCPTIVMWWFLFCICNMAAPISLNLLSEVLLLNSLVSYSPYMMGILSLICFFSGAYSIMLFSGMSHGNMNPMSNIHYNSGNCLEYTVITLHWIPLNLLILKVSLLFYLSATIMLM